MQTCDLENVKYNRKSDVDIMLKNVVHYLAYTPRIEAAEYLAHKVQDCLMMTEDDAAELCLDLGFADKFVCTGFDGNRRLREIPEAEYAPEPA
jgi:hypothetical protein